KCDRLQELVEGTVIAVGPGLGLDVDDTAESRAILRIEAAGHHLNLFHEVEVNAAAQRTERTAVGAEATVPGVGHIGAVDVVLVFKARSAVDRRISRARARAVGNAR